MPIILSSPYRVSVLTIPWDLSNTYYTNKSVSIAAQHVTPKAVVLSLDKNRMYLLGGPTIYQYDLGTTGDVDTAVYNGVSYSVGPGNYSHKSLCFSNDGLTLYTHGWETVGTDSEYIDQHTLSSAWDVGTASFTNTINITGQAARPVDIALKPDGTKIFILDNTTKSIFSYSLSTPYDILTLTYDSISFDLKTILGTLLAAESFSINPEGTKLIFLNTYSSSDELNECEFGTPWDITTLTDTGRVFNVLNEDTTMVSVYVDPDGYQMYLAGNTGDSVYQYDISG